MTNIADPTPEQVIGAYHQLFQIEKSFRMAKSDLAARPIYHHTKDSIEAHLTIVFAALAVSRWIEDTTGWSIKKFVKTIRRYRTIQIQAGEHAITAADPLPDDVHQILEAIKTRATAHQLGPTRVSLMATNGRRPRAHSMVRASLSDSAGEGEISESISSS